MDTPGSRSKRVIIQRSVAEFLREAAVLVGVFGYLDPIFKGNGIAFAWVVGVGGVFTALFLLGLFFEVRASA